MLVELDLAAIFQLFCLAQGFTSAAYLWRAQPRLPGNRWLALLLAAMLAQVVDYFLSRSGVYGRHRGLYFTPLFFSWGFGPLLLAYVRALLGAPPLMHWRWHLVPLGVQVGFYTVLVGLDFDTKTQFWLAVHKPITRYVEHYGAVVSWALYVAAAAHLVARAGRQPRWLWQWLVGVGGFTVIVALDPLLNAAYLPARAPKFYLSALGLPVLTYALAVLGWRENLRRATAATAAHVAEVASTEAYDAARADAQQAAAQALAATAAPPRPPADPALVARVVDAFETAHLYRVPDLTLDALAQHVGVSANAISHVVNEGLGQSFADVVNGYRLEEVKRRLLTPDADRFTVLALAFDAGFNSKTTFNRIFKERTGYTPREYRTAGAAEKLPENP